MKNKKFTSILIISVAALWGIIFYRIFTINEKNEAIIPINNQKITYFNAINHINDPVKPKLDYRDPFSLVGTYAYIKTEKPRPTKMPILAQSILKPQVNWEAILYTGYIYNTNTKQNLVIILASGKEFMLTEGQALNGVKLVKYAGDSVKIQYQNNTKYIKLK